MGSKCLVVWQRQLKPLRRVRYVHRHDRHDACVQRCSCAATSRKKGDVANRFQVIGDREGVIVDGRSVIDEEESVIVDGESVTADGSMRECRR
jgi:hypothetical protein